MIQVLSVLPCSRALNGPNGFHVKAGSFVRNIFQPEFRDIDFVVCLRVEGEPPPEVEVEVLDPWTETLYRGSVSRELELVSPIHQVCVTVQNVILRETGEHAFQLILNGARVFTGPLWGYNR